MLRVFASLSLLALLTLACGTSPAPDEAPKKSDIKGPITVDVKVGAGNEATFGRDGGRRTLTIPPEMAYRAEGLGELIPPTRYRSSMSSWSM